MRLVVVAFLASLLVSQAAAQLLTDPLGDVKAQANDQSAPVAQATALDLASLNVTETPDAFRFTVQVADLGDDQPRPDAGIIAVLFTFDNVTFRADYYRSFDNAAYFGSLYSSTDGESFRYLRPTNVMRDLASSTIWQDVDRTDLVGASGKLPGRGDTMQDIRVLSTSRGIDLEGLGAPAQAGVVDFMPDAVGAVGAWPVVYHGQSGAGAVLSSPKPFRSSNGEATTYEYQVTAKQTASTAPLRFRLSATEVPRDWNVTLPGALLELTDTPVTFPVRVGVPFNHAHGAAQSLTLRLEQADGGASWATLDLGVHFTSIPQPAGHHPTLYLHSRDWSQTAYLVNPVVGGATGAMTMNALEIDPADTLKGVEGYSNFGDTMSTWTWNVCLSPELAIGLDIDLEAEGSFSIPVQTTRTLTGAAFTGQLIHLAPGEEQGPWCFGWQDRTQTVLSQIKGDPKDLSNAPAVLTGTVTPDPAGDFMPFADGAQLVLQLVLVTNDPAIGGTGGPFILPGASVTFPLKEYHEATGSGFVQGGETPVAPGFVTEPTTQSSPAVGPIIAVGLVALALLVRRRHA